MFKIGDEIAKPYAFSREAIRQFAEMSGDANPFHHDETAAAASRYGGLIASGAQIAALLMGVAASWTASARQGVGLDFHFRFKKAIPAGTETMLTWKVTDVAAHERLGGELLSLEGRVTDAAGTVYAICQGHSVVWPDIYEETRLDKDRFR